MLSIHIAVFSSKKEKDATNPELIAINSGNFEINRN